MPSIIRRRPAATFFVLAFLLSWGSYWILSGPAAFPFGPFISSLIVAAFIHRDGPISIARRCLQWRVPLRWFVWALLLPVAIAVAASTFNVLLGAPQPPLVPADAYHALALLPVALIDAPLWEEFGWRGYALPLLVQRRSPLRSTLILGTMVAGWHLPVAFASPAAVPYVIATFASVVVGNWLYFNARSSALIVILFHSAQNAIGGYFLFPLFGGAHLVTLWWLFAATYCAVAIALVAGRHASG